MCVSMYVVYCVFVCISVCVGEVRGQFSGVSALLPPCRGTWVDRLAGKYLQP